jgi:hypothetical protein
MAAPAIVAMIMPMSVVMLVVVRMIALVRTGMICHGSCPTIG